MSQYIIDIGYANYIKYNEYVPLYIHIIKYPNNKNNKVLKYVIDYILDKINIKYKKDDSVENKYIILDKIIREKKNNNSFLYKIHYHIYKLLIYLLNNKNYSFLFENYIFKYMSNNFFGIYSFNGLILYYNNKVHKITITESKFKDSDIHKLKEFNKKHNIFQFFI
jgi:hypothetical protein